MLKNMKDVDRFVESLYIRMPDLEKIYDEQVLATPSQWNISMHYSNALKENLFHKEWLHETKSHFLTFIKASLKIK